MNKQPNLPAVLFRGFEHFEHARAFVDEGFMRFGWLKRYREIEDARRRDRDEGTAEFRAPAADSQDAILQQWKGNNWIYVLSCTASERGASEFGHVVRINNPESLVSDIRGYFSSHPSPMVYAAWVRYDRGATVLEPVDIDKCVTLAYTQKALCFAAQREYRIALFYLISNVGPLADPSEEAIFLTLNRRLSYCDLLS
jgi:hypothetical protein